MEAISIAGLLKRKDLLLTMEKIKFPILFQILPADILIRVSDVVPEIVDYCQKIIDNGFG